MAVTLIQLKALGPGKSEALIDFRFPATLIRGPSDTGKSYIRDCLWVLLGGDKNPKKIPQAVGYDTLTLLLDTDGQLYEIRRALAGGETRLTLLSPTAGGEYAREPIDEEIGDFLVKMSGAAGKLLLRSRAKRGSVTGGDLRHWFLLSQPSMISEDATSGQVVSSTQRIAAFHMFLTGTDDSAIELAKTSAEKQRITGQLLGLEDSLKRVRAELPSDQTRNEVVDALERVDGALGAMTQHYEERASRLKSVREEIFQAARRLQEIRFQRDHSQAMVERFELLDEKYCSDSERLGATWEGVSMFQALTEVPCPLCGTPAEAHVDPRQFMQGTQDLYRRALKAELEKIVVLRHGLADALTRERMRIKEMDGQSRGWSHDLSLLEQEERKRSTSTRLEFSGDPKTLALRRSELSEYLTRFDEETNLIAEVERLSKSKSSQRIRLERNVGDAARDVAQLAKDYLHAWGFELIDSVVLDADACDLVINDRARLDFGAGKRSIFLAALTVAVMAHALEKGHPHLGFVVIDSPLKSYADPKSKEQHDVAVLTVTDRFYEWLAGWSGPGQVIILENQEIKGTAKELLNPTEFVGDAGSEGRLGFYPVH